MADMRRGIRRGGGTDIPSLRIADHEKSLLLTVADGSLVYFKSFDPKLLIHGDLRLYRWNNVIDMVHDFFIKLPDGLRCAFQCLTKLIKCLSCHMLRYIAKHRIQSNTDGCLCFLNPLNQLINHSLLLRSSHFLYSYQFYHK